MPVLVVLIRKPYRQRLLVLKLLPQHRLQPAVLGFGTEFLCLSALGLDPSLVGTDALETVGCTLFLQLRRVTIQLVLVERGGRGVCVGEITRGVTSATHSVLYLFRCPNGRGHWVEPLPIFHGERRPWCCRRGLNEVASVVVGCVCMSAVAMNSCRRARLLRRQV